VCGKEWNSRHFVERSYRKTSTVSNKTETELSMKDGQVRKIYNENAIQWSSRDRKKVSNTIIPDDGLRCQEKVKKSNRRK